MANHKDAIKRNKQNLVRRTRNRAGRTRMRNQIKKVRTAVEAGDHVLAMEAFRDAKSTIQRIASKGIIHRNQASRRIARLNAAVKAIA